MIKKEVTVKITAGLDARPVAMFVQLASQFESNIYLEMQDKRVSAKSIMGIMSLGVIEGEAVIISADGKDEAEALKILENYLLEV